MANRTAAEDMSGTGVGGDPLIPLKHRPQVALARSVIAILEAHRVMVPHFGPMSAESCRDLPLCVVATLCAAKLLDRAAVDVPIAPAVRSSPYGRTPRLSV